MASTTYELSWLLILLKDFQIVHSQPALVFCDNKIAIYIGENLVFHERTKYIEIDCHIVREKLQAKVIKTLHVASEHQLNDIFTKALGSHQFYSLLSKMSVVNIYTPS